MNFTFIVNHFHLWNPPPPAEVRTWGHPPLSLQNLSFLLPLLFPSPEIPLPHPFHDISVSVIPGVARLSFVISLLIVFPFCSSFRETDGLLLMLLLLLEFVDSYPNCPEWCIRVCLVIQCKKKPSEADVWSSEEARRWMHSRISRRIYTAAEAVDGAL